VSTGIEPRGEREGYVFTHWAMGAISEKQKRGRDDGGRKRGRGKIQGRNGEIKSYGKKGHPGNMAREIRIRSLGKERGA